MFTDPEAKVLRGGGAGGDCGDRAAPRAYCAAHKIDSLLPPSVSLFRLHYSLVSVPRDFFPITRLDET